MQAYAGTDIGCVRTMNQEGYFCSETHNSYRAISEFVYCCRWNGRASGR